MRTSKFGVEVRRSYICLRFEAQNVLIMFLSNVRSQACAVDCFLITSWITEMTVMRTWLSHHPESTADIFLHDNK